MVLVTLFSMELRVLSIISILLKINSSSCELLLSSNFFDILLATLANAFVRANPILTGIPVHFKIVFLIDSKSSYKINFKFLRVFLNFTKFSINRFNNLI